LEDLLPFSTGRSAIFTPSTLSAADVGFATGDVCVAASTRAICLPMDAGRPVLIEGSLLVVLEGSPLSFLTFSDTLEPFFNGDVCDAASVFFIVSLAELDRAVLVD
jgi:hypothetical protein